MDLRHHNIDKRDVESSGTSLIANTLPCHVMLLNLTHWAFQHNIYRQGEKHSLNQMEAPGIKLHQMEADPLPAADSDDPHINPKTPPPPLLQTASLHISIHHMPKRVLRRFPPPLSDLARCESSPPPRCICLLVGFLELVFAEAKPQRRESTHTAPL